MDVVEAPHTPQSFLKGKLSVLRSKRNVMLVISKDILKRSAETKMSMELNLQKTRIMLWQVLVSFME